MEWQHIESAPRDGTPIIVLAQGQQKQKVVSMARFDTGYYTMGSSGVLEQGIWMRCDWPTQVVGVTHWIPLPSLDEDNKLEER